MRIPIIDMKSTGQNIIYLRRKQGLTVRQLQALLGFATPQAIYKWQNGTSLPTIDNLVALSCILCVPIDAIIITNIPS